MISEALHRDFISFMNSTLRLAFIDPIQECIALISDRFGTKVYGSEIHRTVVLLKNGKQKVAFHRSYHDALCLVYESCHDMKHARIEHMQQHGLQQYATRKVTMLRAHACAHVICSDGYSFDIKMTDMEALKRRVNKMPNIIACDYGTEIETISEQQNLEQCVVRDVTPRNTIASARVVSLDRRVFEIKMPASN